jgi:DNA-binding response OmpR family regulator
MGAADYLAKPIDREHLLAAIQRVTRTSSRDRVSKSVLVVDDDPLVLELMEAVLCSEGFEILRAEDGRTGVQIALQRRPGLIVLDLLMPDVDGFQVVDELRRNPDTTNIPIIVLTNKSLSREDKDRLNGRISDIRQKAEFSRAEFVGQVHALLRLQESSWQTS